MNKKQKAVSAGRQGFTLIELLVVIAIIGLLATIALASLNSARIKSADSAVKANLANMMAQAEIYYESTGNFGFDISNCTTGVFSDPIIQTQLAKADSSTNTGAPAHKVVCSTSRDGQSWAAMVGPVKSDINAGWCIDNQGHNRLSIMAGAPSNGTCP